MAQRSCSACFGLGYHLNTVEVPSPFKTSETVTVREKCWHCGGSGQQYVDDPYVPLTRPDRREDMPRPSGGSLLPLSWGWESGPERPGMIRRVLDGIPLLGWMTQLGGYMVDGGWRLKLWPGMVGAGIGYLSGDIPGCVLGGILGWISVSLIGILLALTAYVISMAIVLMLWAAALAVVWLIVAAVFGLPPMAE